METTKKSLFVIVDITNNTGKYILAENGSLVEFYNEGIIFETREKAQIYFDQQELDKIDEYQSKWAEILEITEESI